MAFNGFGPQALPFLEALAFHQTREWFEANRGVYESDLKGPMGDLVEDLSAAFARAKLPLKGDRKSSLFRINRDVRFAKDKSPYKTNVGAVMTRGAAKNEPGLYYVHVATEGSFTAAGFYHPEPRELANIRAAMARDPAAWKRLLAKLARAGLKPSDEYALTRLPRGYEATTDEDLVAGLKLKSIVCMREIAKPKLSDPNLIDDLVAFAHDALPLLQWGWQAVVEER
ncbi:MAG: TIGR02453 family protein [Roseiarcus sp.]